MSDVRPSLVCRVAAAPAALFACLLLGGCLRIGPERLAHDEIGYSRALAASANEQTLLNIVRLRYAEAPTFLDLTQVISGYQTQQSLTGSFNVYPKNDPNTYLGGSGSVQLQESPTFTYAPVTGDQYAESFLRPLSPATVLPLALGGLPIDVLFRLAVQSIGSLNNTRVLTGNSGAGSNRFFLLLRDLRALQIAGLLNVRLGREGLPTGQVKDAATLHVFASIASSDDPALTAIGSEARKLLGVPVNPKDFEVIYGRASVRQNQVAILTRSVLGILGEIAYTANVPSADVRSNQTVATFGDSMGSQSAVVIIHSGRREPGNAFAKIQYNRNWFWISTSDFNSKVAFAVVQILLALAETTHAPGTVITIPTG